MANVTAKTSNSLKLRITLRSIMEPTNTAQPDCYKITLQIVVVTICLILLVTLNTPLNLIQVIGTSCFWVLGVVEVVLVINLFRRPVDQQLDEGELKKSCWKTVLKEALLWVNLGLALWMWVDMGLDGRQGHQYFVLSPFWSKMEINSNASICQESDLKQKWESKSTSKLILTS